MDITEFQMIHYFIWSANSIKELSTICPIAYPTLIRMKKQDLRCKLYNKYKLTIND